MQTSNKRIARNTLYMYVRHITLLVVGLYTSRLVLEILGVSDYGLFAVVGGVLAIFTFISSSLATATSRFFNIEMGRKGGDVNASFNINLTLHIAFALIIFILAETIGLWYVTHWLNVTEGKMGDAVFVYHISILTACLGIINTPYHSLFTAHERFRFLMVWDVVNVFIRLGCILSLSFYQGAYALRLYAIIFSLTTANTFVVYHVVSHRQWREIIRFRFVREWKRYREVLGFGGWNMLATLAYTARTSGSDLVLNRFFGTAMNGAFAISRTAGDCITSFTSNFDEASAPQIIQAYAAGDMGRVNYLCHKVARINLLLYEMVCFPLLIQLGFVLRLWLGKVPEGATRLTFIYIILGGVSMTASGIFNVINASGKIKWFKINVSLFFLLCIPLSIMLFELGLPAYSILLLFIIADTLQRIVQLIMMKRIIGFDSWTFVKEAYTRPALVAALLSAVLCGSTLLPINGAIMSLITIAACAVLTAGAIGMIGLDAEERGWIIKKFTRLKIS